MKILKPLAIAAALVAVIIAPAKAQDANALDATWTVVYYDWFCSPQVPLSPETKNALAYVTSFASREANDAAEAKIKQVYVTLGRGRFCAAMASKAEADLAALAGRQ
jgi:hypothetical protein